jgi:hypothetical protein
VNTAEKNTATEQAGTKINAEETKYVSVGFESLTAAVIKISVFWYITPCSPLKVSLKFG